MSRPLWPHQSQCVSEALDRIESGSTALCLTSPTGGGKSTIIEKLLEAFVSQGHHCAVFTNRKLLTSQLSKGLNSAGIHLGVRAANFESWSDPNAPVQICSMQTEVARVLKKRARAIKRAVSEEDAHADHKLFPATRVIIDEVHLNSGDQMTAIVREYQEKYQAAIFGFTATPLGVNHICDELIVAGNTSELRDCGALVVAHCYEPASFDIWKVRRTKSGIYSQQELEDRVKAIWSQHVVGHVFNHWKKLNPDGRPSLGMAPGVKESLGLATEFYRQGINAAHIDGEGIFVDGQYVRTTEQEARDALFARSKSGDVPIIWNRFVLREAIDLPWLEFLSLATPIASLTSFLQTVGRILRASPLTGKTIATVIDHGGAVRMHGSPNLDRDDDWRKYFQEDADKITKDRIDHLKDPNSNEPEPITCPQCGMIRKTGAKCPGCHYEHPQSIRKVIQEDGRLVKVEGDVFPKRRTKMFPNTESLWKQCYFRCMNAKKPMSFNQARGLFKYENHYFPPTDLPFMPKNATDWSRKIKAVDKSQLIMRDEPKPVQQSSGRDDRRSNVSPREKSLFE
jgi:DNA repair protein RadD